MDWTEQLYLRSRGIDLGTFSGAILSSAFKEQSSKWASYVSHIIVVIHRFMVITLNRLCTDAQVREELWSSILEIHAPYYPYLPSLTVYTYPRRLTATAPQTSSLAQSLTLPKRPATDLVEAVNLLLLPLALIT